VGEAYSIAQNIYDENRADKSDTEIQKMILDVLRPIRYANGNGCYGIHSLEGIGVLCPCNPELEGRSILSGDDLRALEIATEMIETARGAGNGGCQFSGDSPDGDGEHREKISYFKLFKPYGWVIGTGLYLDDIEMQVKSDFLEQVNSARYGKNGYFFVSDRQGIVLAHGTQPEFINMDMHDITNSAGTVILQRLIEVVSSKEGGYAEYLWNKPGEDKEYHKIAYVADVPGWDCCLATGVYLDDIENVIASQQELLNHKIREKTFVFIALIAGVIVLFILFINRFNTRLEHDLSRFILFFKRSVDSDEKIDRRPIRFTEFDQLAQSANEMQEGRIRAGRALQDEKEQLSVTLRSIGDGVITTDVDGRVTLMNAVAERMTGWSAEEAAGKIITDVFRIVGVESGVGGTSVGRVIKEKQIVDIKSDSTLISRDGKEYSISDSAAPIRDSESNIRGVVFVFRDVTEQRKTESMLFNAKKLESIGVLAGGIAHDFNNVLTGLFGNIEMAKCSLTREHDAFLYIEMAEKALASATDLTTQLLTFSKGGAPLLMAVSLKDIVIEAVKFNLSGSNVKVDFDLPDDLWSVNADKGQLNQVIANITINAKQAMPNGGCLRISAENIRDSVESVLSDLNGDHVKLVISDDGAGITPENIERIFDPYFSTKSKGNGLGLAAVHSIVARHNGHIQVDSKPGLGTSFTIFLPAKSRHQDNAEVVCDADDRVVSDVVCGHVLIMDDEPIIISTLTPMLRFCGYTSESSGDGSDALVKYVAAEKAGKPFSAVIMDLTIPGGMGGIEAVQELLAFDPDAKVIVSSGYSVDPVLSDYADYGFKGRLIKPFKMCDLAKELNRVISS
jgi:PAS domain S-box-containing protein